MVIVTVTVTVLSLSLSLSLCCSYAVLCCAVAVLCCAVMLVIVDNFIHSLFYSSYPQFAVKFWYIFKFCG